MREAEEKIASARGSRGARVAIEFYLELVEHEEGSGDEAAEGYAVVPAQRVAEVEDAEYSEDRQGDDLLDDLELVGE